MKIWSILTPYYLQTKRNLKRCNLGHILNFLPCFLGETENPGYFPSHLLLLLLLAGIFDKEGANLGPVAQSPISTNPVLTLNKTYRVNPGLALIGL